MTRECVVCGDFAAPGKHVCNDVTCEYKYAQRRVELLVSGPCARCKNSGSHCEGKAVYCSTCGAERLQL